MALFPNGFMPAVRNNSDALFQAGLGLISGPTAQQQAALGASGFVGARKDAKQRNMTLEYLQRVNPQLAEAFASGMISGKELGPALLQAQMPEKPTDDIREYNFALSQGYKGSLQDWITEGRKAGATNVTVGGGKYGTIPQGYMLNEGPNGATLQPIAGGPAAMEAETVTKAQAAQADQAKTQATVVRGNIRDIKATLSRGGMFNLPEVGIVGSRLAEGKLNQEAVDIANKLNTIQSSVAFDRLQKMREASPTGGALGAVSERELALLQSTMGSLSNTMSKEELAKSLDFIDQIMAKFEAYPGDAKAAAQWPEGGQQAAPAPAPASGGVVSYKDYFGGQ